MRLSLPHAVVGAVLIATLTACGGSSSDDSSDGGSTKSSATPTAGETAADAADGDAIKGTGYTFQVPDGWGVPKQEVAGTDQADTFAADLDDKDGFADNVNVVRQDPTPGELTDGVDASIAAQLTKSGAKNVQVRDQTSVAGDKALHISSEQAQNLSDQYYVVHDKVFYVVTLSYSTDVSQAEQDKTAASILATWKWAA